LNGEIKHATSMPEAAPASPYELDSFYDEMFADPHQVRPHYQRVYERFAGMGAEELTLKMKAIQKRMMEEGITFTLASGEQAEPMERTIPFDLIPRVIPASEWELLERGLRQRVEALNLFIHDVYHEQEILKDGIIPRKMIIANRYFRPEMMNVQVPGGVYITTSGIDLIRDEHGRYFVLEDNLRSPSGFSYLYKSRMLMNHLFPQLTLSQAILDVDASLNRFLSALRRLAPGGKANPVIALLTPGSYNSAYYEHAFLAQQMGIHLVEGRDLIATDHKIYMKGIKGPQQVDVIYRRIDDDYLDPLAFHPDSVLGVAGIMNAYRAGNVAIANAPGAGVADDKA
jgi:uncharacterized circularly permuted ATP-grasp superfamily protein